MSAVIKSPDNDDGQLTKEKPDEEAETKSKQPLWTTIRRYAVLTNTQRGILLRVWVHFKIISIVPFINCQNSEKSVNSSFDNIWHIERQHKTCDECQRSINIHKTEVLLKKFFIPQGFWLNQENFFFYYLFISKLWFLITSGMNNNFCRVFTEWLTMNYSIRSFEFNANQVYNVVNG